MAKRELSSTLKNLKFMQRGVNKEEKPKKEEEVIPNGDFPAFATAKTCMVIMEGDPSPGAIRGRMSFQSFNPLIDKLNEPRHSESDATCSEDQGGKQSNRETELQNGLVDSKEETPNSNKSNGDLKRKQAEIIADNYNINENGNSSSNNKRKNSHKPNKRGKLDFNVLRSPKSQSKRG